MQQEQQAARQDGEDVHVQQDLAEGDRALPAEQDAAVAPQQRQLDHQEHAGEQHPILAQNAGDQGDH